MIGMNQKQIKIVVMRTKKEMMIINIKKTKKRYN